MSNRRPTRRPGPIGYFAAMTAVLLVSYGFAAAAPGITNLHQLTESLRNTQHLTRDTDLEVTVCAASHPSAGVVIVQDDTGVELLQMGDFGRVLVPGERIRIRGNSCWLRKREMGVEISAKPIVENDGLHPWLSQTGSAVLPAGKVPLRLEWFNYWRARGLEVNWSSPQHGIVPIAASNLWHAVVTDSGETNFLPGLRAECFEGTWELIPDFNLLHPVKKGVVTTFDLAFRSRDERVGIRYSGYLEVPIEGRHNFELWSDDGCLLFLGQSPVSITSLGRTDVPIPASGKFPEQAGQMGERHWVTLQGRVTFVSQAGKGLQFDLGNDRQVVSVRMADSTGVDPSALMNSRVRVTGIGRGVMTVDQTRVLGKLFATDKESLSFVEPALTHGNPPLPITSVAQVQGLPIELARKSLPVRIRGTVTGAISTSRERWMSFQDDTRGIFVRLAGITNVNPGFGELWEVEGHSDAGDFAPIVVADRMTRLGEGLLPSPVKPTWAELLNGSRDVQWAEVKGLVTEVHSNTISLHLPEGRLDVEMEGRFAPELTPFLKDVVKIRGVLYAVWDAATREVRVGRIMMRNATISVDVPAPADPFDAVTRTPRELLLFDAQASAFRPVKVHGQIVYADPSQLFLQADGTGLKLLPIEKTDMRPGDLVEAVGYPSIGKVELVLREALLKRTGRANLPPPTSLDESAFDGENLNATRVRVDGRLLGWHAEDTGPVLEMQSGTRLYLARIAAGIPGAPTFRPGSRLALEGVYVGRGQGAGDSNNESFELLLNSLADITVISQPPWWTLPRLLAVLGVVMVILVFTVIWNTQLRRLVEQRTHQLQHEIRERERLERQAALEAERSRIARDLHDDLGSSLTEISVLASTGQLPQTSSSGLPHLFQAIGNRARGLISALDVIVWAVDPEDNSLQSLADYLTGYTNDFFSHTQISCRFKVPVSFPPITLEGRVRHDLLMAVKEALNNIVRHANATEVEFRLAVVDQILELDIADNGKGIGSKLEGSGHGLKNLPARLKNLGGVCTIEPRTPGGTIVSIRLPLGHPAPAPEPSHLS